MTTSWWDQNWAMLRGIYFELSELCTRWEPDLTHAAMQSQDADAHAYAATRKLVEGVSGIRTRETETYFRDMQFPPAVPR